MGCTQSGAALAATLSTRLPAAPLDSFGD